MPEEKKKEIDLIVCDIDSTIFPHHELAAGISKKFIEKLSSKLGIKPEQFKKEIRETSNDPAKLDHLSRSPSLLKKDIPCIKEAVKNPLKSKAFDFLVHEWERDRAKGTALYDGVDKVFKKAKETGARVAILTAGPKNATVFNLFLLTKAKENKLDTNLVEMIVCRDNPKSCVHAKYNANRNPVLKDLEDKTYAIPHEFSKDRKGVLGFIMEQMNTTADKTLMVGDSASDARCAKNAGTSFAYQVEGADKTPDTVQFFKDYLGEEHDFKTVTDKVDKVIPEKDRVNLKTFTEFEQHFSFVPAKGKIAPKEQQKKDFKAMVDKLRMENHMQNRTAAQR